MATIDPVGALRGAFSGTVLLPGEPGYEEGRRVFNAMIDRRPAAIARCADAADVAAAVGAARENDLIVAVRCGGHSIAGLGTCDDGMLIDLSGLRSTSVDLEARTATAGGGVLWGEYDAATQEFGMHSPGGRVTTTGIGGFTTGGGYGWTSSKYGLACDSLVSAEVVLADGSIVRASERENPELFWGIRGGGGNFGVVTEFEFRLDALGPTVFAGLTLFPMERALETMRGWRDWADTVPDEVSTACAVMTAPPEPFVPPDLQGKPVFGVLAMYVGAPELGEEAMRPLRDLRPVVDLLAPMPYLDFQAIIDPIAPPGFRGYWRGEYMRELGDDAVDTFLSHAGGMAGRGAPMSQMVVFRIGQGVAKVPDEATAFSHRDARYLFHPISVWSDPSDDETRIAETRAFASAMRPFGTGASYLNFTAEGNRVRDAYGEEKYARLVALKDSYDPTNLFRLNQNIRPTHPAEPALA
ncbi:FAD-binding oxidoreductase [Actinomadura luteofluorescens]|uniref:FAD-binding oxidoreductase n=1 Tax=Actinomadura luteofluorescens TaxID=46163 RepID=UPI00216426B1|nr:FAD-binding oxidoreductase [Actinomadura glauciflava]MCR3741594.1 FAD/FMN-containing dehydrogenase [Actinomadura glauciflava]